MNLYIVHCGFYDSEVCDGLYESHANFFVTATDFKDARDRAKQLPEFKLKRMHVDGLQEISVVMGHRISLSKDQNLNGETIITNNKHRDLAPQPS